MSYGIRRRLRTKVLALALVLLATTPALIQADIVVDVGRGPLNVRVPSSYAGESTPLVVLLHGYGSSGADINSFFRLEPLVESMGFFYVTPNGTLDLFGNRFWNATDACCNFGGSTVDDVEYLMDLVDAIDGQLNVDPWRIFFLGHSNGGFMAYRIACERPDRVAAIVSLAGATYSNPAACTPYSPVHVLQIHGNLDLVIRYDGGAINGTTYPGAVYTTESWAGHAGCSLTPDTSAPPLDLDGTLTGNESLVTKYEAACEAAGSAELWTIMGAGHHPSLSSVFPTIVMNFLYAHPKPPAVAVEPPVSGPLASLAARPNPFRTRTEFGFELAHEAVVSLTIYDLNGRRVRSLLSGEVRSAGAHRADWDGTSDQGRRLGSGIYFARVDAGTDSRIIRKVVLGR